MKTLPRFKALLLDLCMDRYMQVHMDIFFVLAGLMHNDMFFVARPSFVSRRRFCGHSPTNELIVMNSLKMKLSVLFDVLQVIVGLW